MNPDKMQLYFDLCHAMQTGVKLEMEFNVRNSTEPKHLRVGINTAMSDHGALVALLVRKGVFTQEEYQDVLIEYMQREVVSYEQRLTEKLGRTIRLA